MGKKSLTKSTTKKKTKKSEKKKTVDASSQSAKTTPAKGGKKKSESAASAVAAPLSRQFESWRPAKPWKPTPDKAYEKNFSAPPFIEGKGSKKIRSLLLTPVDLAGTVEKTPEKKPAKKKEAPQSKKQAAKEDVQKPAAPTPDKDEKTEKKPAEKPKTAPKKKMTAKELISLSFDSWTPEKPFAPDTAGNDMKNYKAPPAFEGVDPSLILKSFDLSTPDERNAPEPVETESAQPEPEAPQAAEVEAKEPEPAPEPEPEPEPEKQEPEQAAGKAADTKAVEKPDKAAGASATPEATTPPPPPREDIPGGGDGGGGDGGDASDPPPPPPQKDPLLGRGAKLLVATVGFIFLMLIASSIANSNRYFIKETRQGVEIWQGEFSPKGQQKIAALANAAPPKEKKEFYSQKEAMALAYDYYMDRTRALMKDTDEPIDLRGIRTYLENAREFAITADQKEAVVNRMRQVDFAMLLYKAEIEAEKQTLEGYERALNYLQQAGTLNIDSIGRRDMLDAKMEQITARIKSLAPEAPAEEEEPREAETTENNAS